MALPKRVAAFTHQITLLFFHISFITNPQPPITGPSRARIGATLIPCGTARSKSRTSNRRTAPAQPRPRNAPPHRCRSQNWCATENAKFCTTAHNPAQQMDFRPKLRHAKMHRMHETGGGVGRFERKSEAFKKEAVERMRGRREPRGIIDPGHRRELLWDHHQRRDVQRRDGLSDDARRPIDDDP